MLNQHYCVRVRARGERDTGNQDVYGDFTYLDDGTGSAFQWVGYPTGGACTPTCNPGYLGADDYLLPARGTLTRLTPLITWKPIAGKQSYFVIVSKDPNFSNLADYAFTQVPAYSPRSQIRPTTYSDETTLYYWAVLPATGLNGSGAVGDPLSAAPSNFQKQSLPPTQMSPDDGALLTHPAGLPVGVRRRSAPLPLPGCAGAHVREPDRGRAHAGHLVHAAHDLPGRHDALLACPRRRREPDRAHLVERPHVPAQAARADDRPREPDDRRLHAGVALVERDRRVRLHVRDRRPGREPQRIHRAPDARSRVHLPLRAGHLALARARRVPEAADGRRHRAVDAVRPLHADPERAERLDGRASPGTTSCSPGTGSSVRPTTGSRSRRRPTSRRRSRT